MGEKIFSISPMAITHLNVGDSVLVASPCSDVKSAL